MEVIKIIFKDGNIRYIGNKNLCKKIDWQLVCKITDSFPFANNSECLEFLSSQEGFSTLSRISGTEKRFEITNIEFLEVKSVEIENLLSTRKEISEIITIKKQNSIWKKKLKNKLKF